MGRRTELLLTAAEALERGEDPFGDIFLSDNKVSLHECYDLSDDLALGARTLITIRGARQQ